jgi:hypothetical protein
MCMIAIMVLVKGSTLHSKDAFSVCLPPVVGVGDGAGGVVSKLDAESFQREVGPAIRRDKFRIG